MKVEQTSILTNFNIFNIIRIRLPLPTLLYAKKYLKTNSLLLFFLLLGEYVIQGELPQQLVTEETGFDLLEEALQLVELGDETDKKDEQTPVSGFNRSD